MPAVKALPAAAPLEAISDAIDRLLQRLGDVQQLAREADDPASVAICGTLARKIWAAERKLIELALVFGETEISIQEVETVAARSVQPRLAAAS